MTAAFKPKVQAAPVVQPAFSGGGLLGQVNSSGIGMITPNADRLNTVAGLTGAGQEAANTFGDLYNTVKPGFNDLLSARLNQFNDSARSAIGDLSQNLSARRILGSSFGQDTLTRARSEFSRQRDNIVADNFLKSLDAQQQLTKEKFNASIQAFQPKLNELNLESTLAQQLGSQGAQMLAQNYQFNAQQTTAANAAGLNSLGSLLGTGLGLAKSAFTGGFGGFGGGGGSVTAGSYGGVPYPIFG